MTIPSHTISRANTGRYRHGKELILPEPIRKSVALLLAALLSIPAAAQDRKTGADLMSSIMSCRQLRDSIERLACYDRSVGTLATATESKSVIVLSKDEIAEKRRAVFGLQSPATNVLDRADTKTPEITQLDSTVRRLSVAGRDRLMIYLADGSTWRTLEKARIEPRVGEKVKVRRAALGSFVGSYEHSGSIRMTRVS